MIELWVDGQFQYDAEEWRKILPPLGAIVAGFPNLCVKIRYAGNIIYVELT